MQVRLPLGGVIAKAFTQVIGVLSASVFAANFAFVLYGRYRERSDPVKEAVMPGMIFGLSLGALVLAADAVWG